MANMHHIRNFRGMQLDSPRSQQGIVLIICLMVLLVMLVAGIAIIRSSTAMQGIAGNAAFKKTATSVADAGVEAARAWLVTRTSSQLEAASSLDAYESTWGGNFDPLKHDWDTFSKEVTANDGLGNRVRYLIHRMCKKTGSVYDPDQTCVGDADDSGNKVANPDGLGALVKVDPMFRVTVQVKGVRGTVSYTQVMLK